MILTVTPYTGSEKLVQMTEAMLEGLGRAVKHTARVVAVNNGAIRPVRKGLVNWHCHFEENQGFGRAVNHAIWMELNRPVSEFTHVLIANNDLEFPHDNWYDELLGHAESKRICSPVTDRTASKEALATGPQKKRPFLATQISAFCWLVPTGIIRSMMKRFGYPLFDPDFFAYGEDDLVGSILRKHMDPKPFKVVPSSFVKHLKAQTGNELGLKGGDPKNLALLRAKRAKMGLR